MKKHLLSMLFLPLCVAFVSCSEEYNADTAISNYQPPLGNKLVKSLKTTYTFKGNEYSFEHNFTYDAQKRIKEINTTIADYSEDMVLFDTVYTRRNITSRANYFYKGEDIEVAYTISREYPDNPKRNNSESGTDTGTFNAAGALSRFSSLDIEYRANSLQNAYSDGGVYYKVYRDADGNVSGYTKYLTSTDEVLADKTGAILYTSLRNRTNFDFSAYFGYWGVEQSVRVISLPYYSVYQLAAFGMLGSVCKNLPAGSTGNEGEWVLDDNACPVSYLSGNGIRTEISYY